MCKNGASLDGKVVVVTGAGRGIGRAIAMGYARAGASVCCAARTRAEIVAVAEKIRRQSGCAIAVQTDVTALASVRRMLRATIKAFGRLDILVLCAGGNLDPRTVGNSSPTDWRSTIELNLLGAYHCMKEAIPHLKRSGGGNIISVGSGLGHKGWPGRSAYSCSKAGLWMLTRILAMELREDGINVNELIPGPVKTSLDAHVSVETYPQLEGEWIKEPEDVVPLALFLAAQGPMGPTAQSFSLMRRNA